MWRQRINHESNRRRTPRKSSRREGTTYPGIIQYGEVDIMAETDIIKDMSLAIMEKRLAEDGLIETTHSIKTECVLQVESEWETTKDKALSNATKRGVEVDLRLSGDEEYYMRTSQQEMLHREIMRDQIELDFQKREFQRRMVSYALVDSHGIIDKLEEIRMEIP